jgi:AcrR family transcriptional regulator
MELFVRRGYDEVTVAEIAEHAGLTKRSFFRYFTDKREVLFAGAAGFQDGILTAIRDAPDDLAPTDVVIAALAEAGTALTEWGEPVRLRQRVITSSDELRERELIKMANLASAIADALRQRGAEELTATLVAQAGVAVFSTAFQRWTAEQPPPDFRALIDEAFTRLRVALAAG